jgi:hypothetical protein
VNRGAGGDLLDDGPELAESFHRREIFLITAAVNMRKSRLRRLPCDCPSFAVEMS